jgi:hypothetical protein
MLIDAALGTSTTPGRCVTPRSRPHMRATTPAAASPAAPPAASSDLLATVTVDLGPDRAYPIKIGTGLLDRGDLIVPHIAGRRALVVTNETVGPIYLERLTAALTAPGGGLPGVDVDAVILPDGEQYKDMATLMKVRRKDGEKRWCGAELECGHAQPPHQPAHSKRKHNAHTHKQNTPRSGTPPWPAGTPGTPPSSPWAAASSAT